MAERKKLGQILVEMRVVSEEQVHKALLHARQKQIRIGEALVDLGFSDEENVTKALCRQFGLQFVNLEKRDLPPGVVDMLPGDVVVTNRIIPVKRPSPNAVIVALDDPERIYLLDDLRFQTGVDLRPVLTTPSGIRRALEAHWQVVEAKAGGTDAALADIVGGTSDDAPVIRLVDQIIVDAVRSRASDIHVEPLADRVRVRYRDRRRVQESPRPRSRSRGRCSPASRSSPTWTSPRSASPQDGRIAMKRRTTATSTSASRRSPRIHGETRRHAHPRPRARPRRPRPARLPAPTTTTRFERIIKRPNGIFLVTGPTGSGKTTTLYAALQALNRPDVKIITAEDPVEYHLERHQPVPGEAATSGSTSRRILRAMLRQAPNIILVGEIRDHETAEIAIQAALTGHLVFSTLHTNDAPSAITRLIDMGVKPFLVSTAVLAVMAQRLVRAALSGVPAAVRRRSRRNSAIARPRPRSDSQGRDRVPRGRLPRVPEHGLPGPDRHLRAARDGHALRETRLQGRASTQVPRAGPAQRAGCGASSRTASARCSTGRPRSTTCSREATVSGVRTDVRMAPGRAPDRRPVPLP